MGFAVFGDLKRVRDALAPGSPPPCRKEPHSRAEAEAHVRQLKKRGTAKTPERLRAYPCQRCDYWHVGNLKDWELEEEMNEVAT